MEEANPPDDIDIVGIFAVLRSDPRLGRRNMLEAAENLHRRGDKQYGRSRITNGGELLPGVDQRSRWVRRCRDVIAAHLSDLGGEDNTSAAERSIVRRAAVLTTELEQLEVRFATAGEASADDLDLYSRASANLRRLLEAVGLQRRARNVNELSLSDILREEHRD
jgi:hypothetical protein